MVQSKVIVNGDQLFFMIPKGELHLIKSTLSKTFLKEGIGSKFSQATSNEHYIQEFDVQLSQLRKHKPRSRIVVMLDVDVYQRIAGVDSAMDLCIELLPSIKRNDADICIMGGRSTVKMAMQVAI